MSGGRSSATRARRGEKKGKLTQRPTCFVATSPRPARLVSAADPLEFAIAGGELKQLKEKELKDLLRVTSCLQGLLLSRVRVKPPGAESGTPQEQVAGRLMEHLLLECEGRPWEVQEVYERFIHFMASSAFSGFVPKVAKDDPALFEGCFVGDPQVTLSEDSDANWDFSMMPAGTCQAGRYAGMILLANWYPEQIPELTEAIMPAGANCTETVSPPPLPAGAGAAGTSAEAGGGRAAGSKRDGVAAGASAARASKKAKRSAFEDLCSSLGLASEEDSEDDVFESGKKTGKQELTDEQTKLLTLLMKKKKGKGGSSSKLPTPARVQTSKEALLERRKQKTIMEAAARLERSDSLRRSQQLAGSCNRPPSDTRAEAALQAGVAFEAQRASSRSRTGAATPTTAAGGGTPSTSSAGAGHAQGAPGIAVGLAPTALAPPPHQLQQHPQHMQHMQHMQHQQHQQHQPPSAEATQAVWGLISHLSSMVPGGIPFGYHQGGVPVSGYGAGAAAAVTGDGGHGRATVGAGLGGAGMAVGRPASEQRHQQPPPGYGGGSAGGGGAGPGVASQQVHQQPPPGYGGGSAGGGGAGAGVASQQVHQQPLPVQHGGGSAGGGGAGAGVASQQPPPGYGGGSAGGGSAGAGAAQQPLQQLPDYGYAADEELTNLQEKLREYTVAGKRQTVGHLRRLMAAVEQMKDSRDGLKRSIGECYNFLGRGIASGTVSRWEKERQHIGAPDDSSLSVARAALPADI